MEELNINKKCCRNCIHFPCTKAICNIDNQIGCKNFKGISQKAIEIIDNCNSNDK